MASNSNNLSKQGIQDVYRTLITKFDNEGKDVSVLRDRLSKLTLRDKKKDRLIMAEELTVRSDPESPGTVVLNRWPTEDEKVDDLAREIEEARLIEGVTTGNGTAPNWNMLTVDELRDHAADNEINLRGASRKADIIAAIVAGG